MLRHVQPVLAVFSMVVVPNQAWDQEPPQLELNHHPPRPRKQPQLELNLQHCLTQLLAAQLRLKLCCDHDPGATIDFAPEYLWCAVANSWWNLSCRYRPYGRGSCGG